jgi:hypothetical protein
VVEFVNEGETGREGAGWVCSGRATLGIVAGIATRVEEGRQGLAVVRMDWSQKATSHAERNVYSCCIHQGGRKVMVVYLAYRVRFVRLLSLFRPG